MNESLPSGRRIRTQAPMVPVGWREWVMLPELSPAMLKAKIDTGARTSALHAFGLQVVETDVGLSAMFELHPEQRSSREAVAVQCPIRSFRRVRSSNGKVENRPVVSTTVQLGPQSWPIEITLTSRDAMGFRMLLGRAALRRRFVVDPGRSFLLSEKPPKDGKGS